MQAIFELKNILQQWKPPFEKKIETKEVTVAENDFFDHFDGNKEYSFKLLKVDGARALVEYNLHFTMKGYEVPREKRVWIGKQDAVSFTYQWGNDGTTKSLKLKDIVP